MNKSKTPKFRKTKNSLSIDDVIKLKRVIYLYSEVNEDMAKEASKSLLFFNHLSNKPIVVQISSGGGSVVDGLALIEEFRLSRSPIITFLNGAAWSMAGILFLCGHNRVMTKQSTVMLHAMRVTNEDYFSFIIDRQKFHNLLESRVTALLVEKTKLTKDEISFTQRGELWLSAEECLEKGITDKII